MIPHSASKINLINNLKTSAENGLNSEQVAERLERYGENKLKEKRKKTNLRRFLEQFKDAMIIILLIAAVISFVIACVEREPMEFFEPGLILLIVVLNAVMGMAVSYTHLTGRLAAFGV